MPRFTLIKQADSRYDAEVKMEFEAEMVDLAEAHFRDFLQAAGFELPIDDNSTLSATDFLASEEDYMWDEAIAYKFKDSETFNMDGILGSAGADVIQFPSK